MAAYRHTQFAWVLAGVLVPGVLAAIGLMVFLPEGAMRAPWWTPWLLVAVLAVGLLLFGWLTVEVDERRVHLRFGIGAFRRTVPLGDIRSCDRVRTRLHWGWGIRWTPAGWLYNVAGREAVRLELVRERPLIIGSDDADALKAAIDARIAAQAGRQPAAGGNRE
jgi:hypothetical protein